MTTPKRTIDVDGDDYVLRFRYDPAVVEAVKKLRTRRWDKPHGVWRVAIHQRPSVIAFAHSHGFAFTDAAQSARREPPQPTPIGSIDLDGDLLVIAFDFDPVAVQDIKEIRGRRFDATRTVWTAPVTSIRAVRRFAGIHRLTMSAAVKTLPDVAEPDLQPTVTVDNDRFVLIFPFDRDLVALVRDLESARWDRAQQRWTVGLEDVDGVAEWVAVSDARIEGDLAARLLIKATERLARIAESRAEDAEFVCDALRGELLPFQRAGVVYALKALGFARNGATWGRLTRVKSAGTVGDEEVHP